VVVAGHLHHGKTLLCDMFIQQTHNSRKSEYWDLKKELKWTDNRKDEVSREMSIKASPFTLVL
jgi:U5 small nuclear ribonucleoprotein component